MFEVLPCSRRTRRLEPGRGVMAAAFHGLVIFGAIRATAGQAHVVPAPRPDTVRIEFWDDPVPQEPAPVERGGAQARFVPPPHDQLPPPPLTVPKGLPPIVDGPVLDPERVRRWIGAPGPSGPIAGDSTAPDRILAEAQVDEPAAALHQPAPRYPPVLQQTGIEGKVLLEFVIDTTGHPEPASLRVIESSNAGFDAAAEETVRRSLFRPAAVRGRPVRQLTRQAIAFRMARE
jgi:protein TonB